MKLNLENTFNLELPGDPIRINRPRQVMNSCYSYVDPKVPTQPKILHVSPSMLDNVGLKSDQYISEDFLSIFTGGSNYPGSNPYAMCYGGHQFGHWAGQLGDGRAINLFEVVHQDKRWALQLKGAGLTPYSRTADGLAVLRSSIREHLCSEAMFHLGVPTTRSLSLALTGDRVLRDMLYDGNADYEKGAVVCRAAPSFIRFGNFQIFAARKDVDTLEKLTNYTLDYFYPHIKGRSKDAYLQFFEEVATRTMEMVLQWQRVGFVHGVMNTDNMSILGLTIDYGPYGWLEGYDQGWTPNTTDAKGKRYRFGNQASIALWNLAQLGSALHLLIDDVPALQNILDRHQKEYPLRYLYMMREKLGLYTSQPTDDALVNNLERVMHLAEIDMTLFFRTLSRINSINNSVSDVVDLIGSCFYVNDLSDEEKKEWHSWIESYLQRINSEKDHEFYQNRSQRMNRVNPKYVLRNYMAQLAIDKANLGDYSLIDELYTLLKRPYDEQVDQEKWFVKRPEWARNKVGCSMLSCSS